MANKAWDDFVNPGYKPTTRQSVYDQINQSIQDYRGSVGGPNNNQAIFEQEKQKQLKYLLNAMGADSGSGGDYSNPFGGSGAGGSGASGAPTVNTSNRFEAGLSDAETRLRSLLDNPDSVQQTAAYKFRVNQGQEALQRQLGAKGLLNSGNRLMELTKYGQDMGSQEYDNQFGRIKDLVGGYSGSWIGDKNANTGLFNAQANAWNTAQANAYRTRLGYADIAAQNSRAAMSSGGSRSSGGGGRTAGLYDPRSSFNPDAWSYNTGSYDGENTAWTNDRTGAQMLRRG